MKRKYQFFDGLDADGVQTTLDEYANAGWNVHTIGHDDLYGNGFWLLLVSPDE